MNHIVLYMHYTSFIYIKGNFTHNFIIHKKKGWEHIHIYIFIILLYYR